MQATGISSEPKSTVLPSSNKNLSPEIERLIEQYPLVWQSVCVEIPKLLRSLTPTQIATYAQTLKKNEMDLRAVANKNQVSNKIAQSRVAEIRLQLFSIQQFLYEVMARSSAKKLTRLDEELAQRMFFTKDQRRRAISTVWFALFWKMISDKAGVIGLLKSLGIYCVYSQQFGSAIAKLIGKRSCVEIGAGDGTLTLLLEQNGLRIPATDDFSWQHVVRYPDWVEKLDAKSTLAKYQPQVVICSWPPPGNDFEERIFKCETVETYIVIGSKHPYASGNRAIYAEQKSFSTRNASELSRLVLPPELDNEVLVFTRN